MQPYDQLGHGTLVQLCKEKDKRIELLELELDSVYDLTKIKEPNDGEENPNSAID